MLTKLIVRNFKRFRKAEIDLGEAVVFIGPNNSGKTTALQALALWDIGLKAWLEKRGNKAAPEKRPGVAINRKDLVSIPVPTANLLWRGLHVRDVAVVPRTSEGKEAKRKTQTSNIRIDVTLEGVTHGAAWSCGFEFDYSNEESFVVRPIRKPGFEKVPVGRAEYTPVPEAIADVKLVYLPPMSGLADREFLKQQGEIAFLIGQGQTAQVLRNICYQVASLENKSAWHDMAERLHKMFGVRLHAPKLIQKNSELVMEYEEHGVRLDISSAGRGLQQALLLLSHLNSNPGAILLLDEPDAHLEILRQRQTFHLIRELAIEKGSQLIAASHSEVVLNEAAETGKVVAFVGKPHTVNDRGNQVIKALTDIGWDLYYHAEATGWLLCLEGPTDLAILQAFAKTLDHPARDLLDRPFVHYVNTNVPQKARDLFFGLREAKSDLVGVAIFDRLTGKLQAHADFVETMWRKRELENYFCSEDILLRFAKGEYSYDLFGEADRLKREAAMRQAIAEVSEALRTLGRPDPWSDDIKATDEFLDPLFRAYFKKLNLPITFRKNEYASTCVAFAQGRHRTGSN
jgi:ABC-type lipoprotein export system ATPase subunit